MSGAGWAGGGGYVCVGNDTCSQGTSKGEEWSYFLGGWGWVGGGGG